MSKEAFFERVPLRELEDGQRVEGVFAVRERELRRKRNGDPWLRLSVAKWVVVRSSSSPYERNALIMILRIYRPALARARVVAIHLCQRAV